MLSNYVVVQPFMPNTAIKTLDLGVLLGLSELNAKEFRCFWKRDSCIANANKKNYWYNLCYTASCVFRLMKMRTRFVQSLAADVVKFLPTAIFAFIDKLNFVFGLYNICDFHLPCSTHLG